MIKMNVPLYFLTFAETSASFQTRDPIAPMIVREIKDALAVLKTRVESHTGRRKESEKEGERKKNYAVSLAVIARRWSLTARRRCHPRDCKAARTRESEKKLDIREERERCICGAVAMESY